ncbi:MAG: response regulator transcription factor [Thermoanaerobaculia bacterium]
MKRRILLADDSVTIQKVIELTFMDEDYEVRAVSNGDEAVALLSEMNPDFVIADVHMPGANGYDVCRRSKQLRPDVPVLLLVGTFEPFDEGQARSVGADSHLKKPFDSQELLQRVGELLASRAPAAPVSPAATAATAMPDWATPPAPDLPPVGGTAGLPEFSAEPSWGAFELEPEPAAPMAAAPQPAPEPFDREVAFNLEPDPGYEVEAEPVFTIEEDEPTFAVREDVFGAPSELSFDEAPQDRYIPEEPAAPAPAQAAGFSWPAPEPEPLRFEEPPAPVWQPTPEPEPAFPAAAAAHGNGHLSDEDVDRIARRVVELLGDRTIRDVAWEVVPDMAEVIIRDRLRELESQVE